MPKSVALSLPDHLRMADWARLRTEFFWAYEGKIEARYRDTQSHHAGCSALLIMKGTLRVETEHGSVTANPGEWVFPREGRRLQQFSADARVLSLHFNMHWPGGGPLFEWEVAFVCPSASKPGLERLARQLLRIAESRFPGAGAAMFWRHGDIRTHFLLNQSFSAWMNLYIRTLLGAGIIPSRLRSIDSRIEHAMQTIDDLPLDVRFDKLWLAREVGLSASQLNRLFTLQLNLTPRQYYEKRRVVHARELLKNSTLPIKQIAYEVGFHSQPFFSRWFRGHTGLSPREFLRS